MPLVKVPVMEVEPQFKAPIVAGMTEASFIQRTENPPWRPLALFKLIEGGLSWRRLDLVALAVLHQ